MSIGQFRDDAIIVIHHVTVCFESLWIFMKITDEMLNLSMRYILNLFHYIESITWHVWKWSGIMVSLFMICSVFILWLYMQQQHLATVSPFFRKKNWNNCAIIIASYPLVIQNGVDIEL